MTPEWYAAWMRHYAGDMDPAVVVVRRAGGGLRGLLPLVQAPGGPLRAVRFGGGSMGDYFHPVSTAEDESSVACQAVRALGASGVGPVESDRPRPRPR